MREGHKKWLFEKGKTAGSRKRWSYGGDFANERNTKQFKELEDAPKKVGMKTRQSKARLNRLDFSRLRRFLKTKVGKKWDDVYSEICQRIPKDIIEIHNPVKWYVSTKVSIKSDGSLYDKIDKQYISDEGKFHTRTWKYGYKYDAHYPHYFVHPQTGILCRLEVKKFRTVTKKEGKKKFAQYKTQRNQSDIQRKKGYREYSENAAEVMKQKKQEKKNGNNPT
jgi:hypothetical protein